MNTNRELTPTGKNPRSLELSRRQFLRRAGAGVALFNILPGNLLHGAEALSPNAKLNIAGIGIGSRGGAVVGEVAGLGHNIVALCDVDEKYAAKELSARAVRRDRTSIMAAH